ncbi:catalase [Streptomyces sp. NPDC088350]|uniref:catalase n=1 Tax=Streptomyces sp. NPDC088350 TaxID=3365854 RepID=UPI00382875EC
MPRGQLAKWTTAAPLLAESEAVVRFSNGSGRFDADDRVRGVRGMAVKFLDADKGVRDLVAATFRVFPSHDPEGFIDLVEALGKAGTGEFRHRPLRRPACLRPRRRVGWTPDPSQAWPARSLT